MNDSYSPLFDEGFLRRLEQLSLVYRGLTRSHLQGERRSNARGGSVEFADFRPYTLGDDIRRVDWNAYARLERLFIKLYTEEQQIGLHLLVDNSLSMDWGSPNKLDLARRLAAALGYIGLLNLDRVSFAPFCISSKSKNVLENFYGKRSALSLFSACQRLVPEDGLESAQGRLAALLSQIRRPGIFLIFSDLFDPSWKTALNYLFDRGHQLLLVNILSPDEIEPQLEGEFRLVDRENSQHIEFTADFETLQVYSANLAVWQADWKHFCSVRGAAYLPISSALSLEELLFNRLQRIGFLK